MKSKLFCLLVLFCFGYQIIYAQVNEEDDTEIIILEDKRRKKKKKKVNLIIKTSPSTFLSGLQFVEVEKKISDNLSLQGGIGLRFRPYLDSSKALDILVNSKVTSGLDQWGQNDAFDDYSIISENRSYRPGIYLSLMPRLYINSTALEDFFIGLNLRYSKQNMSTPKVEEGIIGLNYLSDDLQDEHIHYFDVILQAGQQIFYKSITLSYFVGAGISNENHTRQDIGSDGNGRYLNGETKFTKTRIRLEPGVRIGFFL